MKQTFNLLSEVLSLPYSELFLEKDLLLESVVAAKQSVSPRRSDKLLEQTFELKKQINNMGERVAKYINLRCTLPNTGVLQDLINYVFDAEEVLKQPPGDSAEGTVNHYYVLLLRRIAKTFLTTRDGKTALKPWSGNREAYPEVGSAVAMDKALDLLGEGFKIHRVEAWHSLLQCLPEDLILSAYALELACMHSDWDRKNVIYQVLQQVGDKVHVSDRVLDRVLKKGMAETHLHAYASRSFGMIWENILRASQEQRPILWREHTPVYQPKITEDESSARAKEAMVVRVLLARFLSVRSEDCSFFRYLVGKWVPSRYQSSFLEALKKLDEKKECVVGFAEDILDTKLFCRDLFATRRMLTLAQILNVPMQMQAADAGFSERCFLAWAQMYIYEHPSDTCFSNVFLYYIRLKNYFYRCRVQDHKSKGLEYFQHYYDQSADTGADTEDAQYANILLTALKDPRICKIELRMSLPMVEKPMLSAACDTTCRSIGRQIQLMIKQHLYAISVLYGASGEEDPQIWEKRVFEKEWCATQRKIKAGKQEALAQLLEGLGVQIADVHHHRIGIVYHFIKSGEHNEERSCFLKERVKHDRDRYAKFSFGKARYQSCAMVSAISRIRSICPELSRLIVGIDAASLEIPTDPWVFAPAFRLARESNLLPYCHGDKELLGSPKSLLGLTYHVGEDFRHPLSGLRHISEAVNCYKLHAGDRLGHALALGIDVERWFSNRGLTTLPRIEWMENCLWAWEMISCDPGLKELSGYTQFLQDQVLHYANEIYGTLDGITVEKLSHAYKNKSLDCESLSEIAIRWKYENTATQGACEKNCDGDRFFPCVEKSYGRCWTEDSLTLSYHCSKYKDAMHKEILRKLSDEEVDLTRSLQKYLRRDLAQKGIFVEANPSSNAVIAEIDGILQHPVWKLRKDGEDLQKVMTTINTDDPSVFNSTVANEHGYIYFSLLYQGDSVEAACDKIDALRKMGVNGSFLEEPGEFAQLLKEYETVLSCLNFSCRNSETTAVL